MIKNYSGSFFFFFARHLYLFTLQLTIPTETAGRWHGLKQYKQITEFKTMQSCRYLISNPPELRLQRSEIQKVSSVMYQKCRKCIDFWSCSCMVWLASMTWHSKNTNSFIHLLMLTDQLIISKIKGKYQIHYKCARHIIECDSQWNKPNEI